MAESANTIHALAEARGRVLEDLERAARHVGVTLLLQELGVKDEEELRYLLDLGRDWRDTSEAANEGEAVPTLFQAYTSGYSSDRPLAGMPLNCIGADGGFNPEALRASYNEWRERRWDL